MLQFWWLGHEYMYSSYTRTSTSTNTNIILACDLNIFPSTNWYSFIFCVFTLRVDDILSLLMIKDCLIVRYEYVMFENSVQLTLYKSQMHPSFTIRSRLLFEVCKIPFRIGFRDSKDASGECCPYSAVVSIEDASMNLRHLGQIG